MQVSHRHHFVPQFLLRQWHASDDQGFWVYFRDSTGHLRCRRKPAKSVAYIDDLYSLGPDFPSFGKLPKPDVLETEYFAKLDADAAIVHQKLLIDDRAPLTQYERRAWARFINSLLERSPARIAELERLSASDRQIRALLEHPVALKLRDGNPGANLSTMLRNNLLKAITKFIDKEEDLAYLVSMKWIAFDMVSPDEHFLTGDAPLVVNAGGAPLPLEMLSIAISPRRLLIMHREHQEFDQQFLGKALVCHSQVLVKQTHRHLISSRRLVDGGTLNYARIAEQLLPRLQSID